MRRAALADRDALAPQLGDGGDRRIRADQDLVADAAPVVGRNHLHLRVGRRAEDRRGVAGDREVDLARGRRLDLRRAGGERGEHHLVRQVVQRAGGAQQRLGAALLITDLQCHVGQLGQRHAWRAPAVHPSSLSRDTQPASRPTSVSSAATRTAIDRPEADPEPDMIVPFVMRFEFFRAGRRACRAARRGTARCWPTGPTVSAGHRR